ncbi:MAG: hypothetical protein WBQ31_05515 [Candidatus Acidiferrales bacterium]
MPPAPDDDASAEEFERGLVEMEDNWYLRQENILPLETAWNEGRFYGLLLKGNRPFTPFQRLGIFVIGVQLAGVASMFFYFDSLSRQIGPSLKMVNDWLPNVSLFSLPVFLLEIALGLRMCSVALQHPPQRDLDAE